LLDIGFERRKRRAHPHAPSGIPRLGEFEMNQAILARRHRLHPVLEELQRQRRRGGVRAGVQQRIVFVKNADVQAAVSVRRRFAIELFSDRWEIRVEALDRFFDFAGIFEKLDVGFLPEFQPQPLANAPQRHQHEHQHDRRIPNRQPEPECAEYLLKMRGGHSPGLEWSGLMNGQNPCRVYRAAG
jgi:hypothetical protein